MCTAVRDTASREPLLALTPPAPGDDLFDDDEDDILSPVRGDSCNARDSSLRDSSLRDSSLRESSISCTTRSQSEFTSYTDYTRDTRDTPSAPSCTDTEYDSMNRRSTSRTTYEYEHSAQQTPAPLDPNWSVSSGSSFSDYTDSSVTLPSLHENGDLDEGVSQCNMLLPPEHLGKPANNLPSSGGIIGRLKGLAVTFVDRILVDERNGNSTTDVETGSLASTNVSFKQNVSSMFSRKSSANSVARPVAEEPMMAKGPPPKPVDSNTLLGMVMKYEESKKTDGHLQPEAQNIPQLIRVEEGAILYRRESPGARSARSGRIGHGFRRQKVNADDSSAFSAYSQISHVSSMGIASLDEEVELEVEVDVKPCGTRPSPLGGRDREEPDLVLPPPPPPPQDAFSDTLDVSYFSVI